MSFAFLLRVALAARTLLPLRGMSSQPRVRGAPRRSSCPSVSRRPNPPTKAHNALSFFSSRAYIYANADSVVARYLGQSRRDCGLERCSDGPCFYRAAHYATKGLSGFRAGHDPCRYNARARGQRGLTQDGCAKRGRQQSCSNVYATTER
ncbi:hypothetical protein MRX96_007110 [Rhipicephalus microplus]